MNNNSEEFFSYSYSAREQEELIKIRSKYLPPEENKLDQLRRLDAALSRKATVVSLIYGIGGTLMLGIGMCCCMVWGGILFIPGITIGLAGIVILALAYPVFNKVLKKERDKIAPQILKLCDELMKLKFSRFITTG